MTLEHNKATFLKACKTHLLIKIDRINEALQETQASANNETKSSAGDKHETSRAMAHLENERLAGQLNALNTQLEILTKINPSITSKVISFGSIVTCEQTTFFLSTGLGKITSENLNFIAIAPHSPVGIKLKAKGIGDEIKMGSSVEKIIAIS